MADATRRIYTRRSADLASEVRVVAEEGTIRDVNPAAKRLTFARKTDSQLVALPLAAKCEVTINHRSDLDGRLLKLEDLQPGDSARISHPTEIVRVDAYRLCMESASATRCRMTPEDFIEYYDLKHRILQLEE